MNKKELELLIKRGENYNIEFKESFSDSITREICAFANANGGKILLGVSDKGKKIKISMTEENHCYENAIAERINGILKDEYYLGIKFKKKSHAKSACKQAINLYNTDRPHLSLKMRTPDEIYYSSLKRSYEC